MKKVKTVPSDWGNITPGQIKELMDQIKSGRIDKEKMSSFLEKGFIESGLTADFLGEVEEFQEFYDWLGLKCDLLESIKERGIALISEKQRAWVLNANHAHLIVPYNISREKIIECILEKIEYCNSNNDAGKVMDRIFSGLMARDINKTYEIFTLSYNPQQYHMDSANLRNLLWILKEKQQKNPNVNLEGLYFYEDLLRHIYKYYKLTVKIKPAEFPYNMFKETSIPIAEIRKIDAEYRFSCFSIHLNVQNDDPKFHISECGLSNDYANTAIFAVIPF